MQIPAASLALSRSEILFANVKGDTTAFAVLRGEAIAVVQDWGERQGSPRYRRSYLRILSFTCYVSSGAVTLDARTALALVGESKAPMGFSGVN